LALVHRQAASGAGFARDFAPWFVYILSRHGERSVVVGCRGRQPGRPTENIVPFLGLLCCGGTFVSIVRLGLSEKGNCAEGYEAIFGKKKETEKKAPQAKAEKTKADDKKKKTSKK
jgi:hypothetical protein